jgi:ABC-2 type transport system ATP-binding protein
MSARPKAKAKPAKTPPKPTGYAVEVKNLTVQFGDFKAVNDISFKVSRGEIFGFLGANGAGKTTTIRVLCGLLEPTAGDVRVAGLGFEDGGNAIKSKVGYMSQKLTIYQDMSVAENMSFIASLRKMEEAKFLARKKELFDFIHFKHDEKALVKELPGGLKQEVSLAAAMLHDPEIVFLDEPTAGVAPASRNRFWSLIRRVAAAGKTVFVTTHYMDEAEQCGRIALMRDGKIIALDSPKGLEKQAFPHPLYEITAPLGASRAWLAKLEKSPGVDEIKTFGMRWHLSTNSSTAWSRIHRHLPKGFKARPILPSLEDVFIRMVEGKKK